MGITVWYSYKTLVAFQRPGEPITVRQNEFSQTTGKHLNWIDGGGAEAKKRRLSSAEFLDAWNGGTRRDPAPAPTPTRPLRRRRDLIRKPKGVLS